MLLNIINFLSKIPFSYNFLKFVYERKEQNSFKNPSYIKAQLSMSRLDNLKYRRYLLHPVNQLS